VDRLAKDFGHGCGLPLLAVSFSLLVPNGLIVTTTNLEACEINSDGNGGNSTVTGNSDYVCRRLQQYVLFQCVYHALLLAFAFALIASVTPALRRICCCECESEPVASTPHAAHDYGPGAPRRSIARCWRLLPPIGIILLIIGVSWSVAACTWLSSGQAHGALYRIAVADVVFVMCEAGVWSCAMYCRDRLGRIGSFI